jgi:hypothetical protein
VSDETEEPDEFTPRERGLLIGREVAGQIAREQMRATQLTPDQALDVLAAGPPQVPRELYDWIMGDGLRERLDASVDPDAESAFWGGFVTGVRAYITEVRLGPQDN